MLVATAEIAGTALSPHFLILPSSTQSLLVKSLAASELMLPMETPAALEQASSAVQQSVARALDQLDTFDTHNPLS